MYYLKGIFQLLQASDPKKINEMPNPRIGLGSVSCPGNQLFYSLSRLPTIPAAHLIHVA